MQAKSKKQQLMGIVRAIQKGDMKPSEASPEAREMAKSMKPKDVKDFAATKHKGLPKKVKKEGISSLYGVLEPTPDMQQTDLVFQFDPLQGVQPHNINMHSVHSVHDDHTAAQRIAAEVYKKCMDEAFALEEKKGTTVNKLKKAVDQLEKKRKEHTDMVKEDPKNASSHREHIAKITTQIDDLLSKMEKIEKSKKNLEEKDLNENANVDLSKMKIGKVTKSPTGDFETTLKTVDPELGKVSWDVSYSGDPYKVVYKKLNGLIDFIEKKQMGDPEMRKVRGILKTLRRQTARLITTQ